MFCFCAICIAAAGIEPKERQVAGKKITVDFYKVMIPTVNL